MNPYQETFTTWNKIAQLYQDKFMDLDLYDDTYAAFCELLPGQAKVLELGCGPGNITRYLLNKRPDLQLDATDVAPNMVALAQQNNPAAHCSVLDCRQLNAVRARYDAIVCGFCIPYLSEEDVEKLIGDCARILNEKGTLYFSFVEGAPERSGYQTGSSGDRIYFYYHDLNKLLQLLGENAFKTVSVDHKSYARNDGSNELHTIVIAAKNQARPAE